MPHVKKSLTSSENSKPSEIVEPLNAVPPDEAERPPGLQLKPVEELIRVLSETFLEESELDN